LLGAGHFEVTPAQWFANLFIAAPLFGQPYVDLPYWSLVIEVMFYVWVAAFIALGLFPCRIDAIITTWLVITLVNDLTIDAPIFGKLFMADDSGFFAIGLLIYQHYRGRRDARLWALSALALGTAVFQAVHKLGRLDVHTGNSFDPKVVAAICIVSLGVVFLATRIKRVPIPTKVVLAVGGITYPLYLLHMQLGYVIFKAFSPERYVEGAVCAIVFGVLLLAYAVWRFAETPAHRWLKARMTVMAEARGWPSVDHPAASV
jgi:peptidoglycan/LPS O-acetylase OafA/YrhL